MDTNTRDCAVSILASLSEQKLKEFIKLFGDEGALTRLECEQLAHDPDAKRYTNFKEFMEEMKHETEYDNIKNGRTKV